MRGEGNGELGEVRGRVEDSTLRRSRREGTRVAVFACMEEAFRIALSPAMPLTLSAFIRRRETASPCCRLPGPHPLPGGPPTHGPDSITTREKSPRARGETLRVQLRYPPEDCIQSRQVRCLPINMTHLYPPPYPTLALPCLALP